MLVPPLGYAFIVGPTAPAAATMPMFTIYTNVCKDAVPESLLGDLTQQLAKATGKPAQVRAGAGRARARRGPAGGAAAERPRGTAEGAAAAQELLRGQEPVPVPPRGPVAGPCLGQWPGLQERGAHVAGDALRLCRRFEQRSCAVARSHPGSSRRFSQSAVAPGAAAR